jgi:glucose-6-phosphate isomerase
MRMADQELGMAADEALARLIREDAIGQLRRPDGAMARLGSEGGALKLDWVEMVPWLLAHPEALADVEREAAALVVRGVRHIIWAGMGGSVLSVRVMRALGFGDEPVVIHPLDSADPAALNAITNGLAGFEDTMMIAVALGMTSEEPISHLDWFSGVLRDAGLDPRSHQVVMALPDSYLDRYAQEQGLPRWPLQLDGGSGTGGRMSAPGTRVFLVPAALYLAGEGRKRGELQAVLHRAWMAYDLDGAQTDPASSQWVRLAVALAEQAQGGAVRLGMEAPLGWETLRDWAEQLMEESLGKDGKGVIVFAPEALPMDAPASLRLRVTGEVAQPEAGGGDELTIVESLIASQEATQRLAGLATLYLGLQLAMALYGYLWSIPFAGQPAVEAYKAGARALRDSVDADLARAVYQAAPLREGRLALAGPDGDGLWDDAGTAASALARWLRGWREREPLACLDVTINGEVDQEALAALDASVRGLAVEWLGIPYKLRRAPAAYHSTEQSEMDGPVGVISLRAVALRHAAPRVGVYSARFLEAQALATWQAMNRQGRSCVLAVYDGDAAEMLAALQGLLDTVALNVR